MTTPQLNWIDYVAGIPDVLLRASLKTNEALYLELCCMHIQTGTFRDTTVHTTIVVD